MNREILFRGKRIDNGEWVEGYLVEKTDFDAGGVVCQSYIVEKVDFGRNADDDIRFCDIDEIEVIPETVGQYTGLTDRNGEKIFDGDIITANIGEHEEELEYLSDSNIEVTFSKGYFYPFGYACGWRSWVSDIQVIGNKWDNPELLSDKS